jgi:hypothetical protein
MCRIPHQRPANTLHSIPHKFQDRCTYQKNPHLFQNDQANLGQSRKTAITLHHEAHMQVSWVKGTIMTTVVFLAFLDTA